MAKVFYFFFPTIIGFGVGVSFGNFLKVKRIKRSFGVGVSFGNFLKVKRIKRSFGFGVSFGIFFKIKRVKRVETIDLVPEL